MIFGSWNVRGLNKAFKQKELKSFMLKNKVVILGCLETKVRASSTERVQRKLGSDWQVGTHYIKPKW